MVLGLTVFGNLIHAVGVGIVLESVLFMKKSIDLAEAETSVEALQENSWEDEDELFCVIELIKKGNARFSSGAVTLRNHREQVRKSAANQFPKAIVLSCVDSSGRSRTSSTGALAICLWRGLRETSSILISSAAWSFPAGSPGPSSLW